MESMRVNEDEERKRRQEKKGGSYSEVALIYKEGAVSREVSRVLVHWPL
jgi:hypothetical protein